MRYYPKRPVKSFQDLEVYQKLNNLAVVIVKRIAAECPAADLPAEASAQAGVATAVAKTSHRSRTVTAPEVVDLGRRLVEEISEKLCRKVLRLPELIASAHSMRFSYPAEAVKKLEEVMLYCNLSVVYLEQYRDLRKIQDHGLPDSGSRRIRLPESSDRDLEPIEPEFFEEQIKTLLSTRGKVMRLQMSWKKFHAEKDTGSDKIGDRKV